MTLTEFLLARIAEDEAAALAVKPPLTISVMGGEQPTESHAHMRLTYAREDGRSWHESDHAAQDHFDRYDPARVLAECKAKHKAIEAAWLDHVLIEYDRGMNRDREKLEANGEVPMVVRALARVYADHPDYRDEWR